MRAAAVVASLAGAVALTACGGDGGSDAKDDSGPSASASASADTGGGTGASASASGGLEGSWLATTDGKAVVLVVNGTEVALFATGGTVCSGTAGEQDGMRMIRLKCPDGSKDRAVGMVDSVGKTRLKVTWQGEGGLGAESYQKAQGGKLPTSLPTAGLGS
ncbi:hypothetical protein QQM39_18770 [Streptomyces sp. DT2A-34]|uniref:hypothetical protein n=1 Tax=Streptomyces sp. DT2A-34 TaxID=3051182 RepID=UPI00265C4614|nr:hypothetical protein [Streptomyces sp. DT2A-34]MDO0912812.1 hypothetical protein [Streptomyces sp. DT2A-34]